MKPKFEKVWELAVPYLKQGIMKDFILHTQNVVKSMELLIAGEGGDEDILIPAAILHDVGWSKVAPELQTNSDLEIKRQGQRQHVIFAGDIIQEILGKLDYGRKRIDRIVEIVKAHKFTDPAEKEKQTLIDADNLSDVWKDQFDSDVKAYNSTPEQVYEFRTRNEYYSETAKNIAAKEMAERKRGLDIK